MPTRGNLSKTVDRLARRCQVGPELVEDAYPCTSLQAALIAASLHGLGDYVSRFVFDVSGAACNPDVLKAACERMHKQNAILRSRVVENGGKFLQVVTIDPLSWLEADNLHNYLARDGEIPVVLGQPLARFAWIREPRGKLWMVWSLHHCQYDEWSFDMLVGDLNTAASQLHEPANIFQRPPFSRFIKALNNIDMAASHAFWQTTLRNLSECRSVCPTVSVQGACRTSRRLERSYNLRLPPNCVYQPSDLSVAAWSLFIAHLSASSSVFFGHVLSGRAFDLEGVLDICGPTLATVPWCSKLPFEQTVKVFLQQVQELRLQILPFEQTGLDEYRKLAGTATFDTLLSVRSSQGWGNKGPGKGDVLPQKLGHVDLNHPCCLFLEMDIEFDHCRLSASYDERMIDVQLLGVALDQFVRTIENLPLSFETVLGDFAPSLQLPPSIELAERRSRPQSEADGDLQASGSHLDDYMMQTIQDLASTTAGPVNVGTIGPDTTLMQLGMDSLKTVVLSRQLSKAFRVSIPFKDITGPRRTLSSLGRSVENALHKNTYTPASSSRTSLLDMAESHMKALHSVSHASSDGARSLPSTESPILLTGATGYLGIEILRQCLAATRERVVLLVRCKCPSDGLDRITKAAEMAAWEPIEIRWLSRVSIWPSDLAKEQLGLAPEHWQLLSDQSPSSVNFKAIIHNGAKVDFLHSYADLEAVNVGSTVILLDQHVRMSSKPNFVYVTGGRPCPLAPDRPEETASKLAGVGGYAQTKFVGEILMHKTKALYEASGQPARMSIVHPGVIIGSSRTGVANTDDFVWRYVAASASMGCYVPSVPTRREWINLTPVDSVASLIVSQAFMTTDAIKAPCNDVQRCLLRMGLSISQFWIVVTETLARNGVALEPVSEWEWLQELDADVDRRGQNQPLFSLSQLLLQRDLKGIGGLPPAINIKTGVGPETTSVEAALRTNVQYLTSKNFFSDRRQSRDVFARGKG